MSRHFGVVDLLAAGAPGFAHCPCHRCYAADAELPDADDGCRLRFIREEVRADVGWLTQRDAENEKLRRVIASDHRAQALAAELAALKREHNSRMRYVANILEAQGHTTLAFWLRSEWEDDVEGERLIQEGVNPALGPKG